MCYLSLFKRFVTSYLCFIQFFSKSFFLFPLHHNFLVLFIFLGYLFTVFYYHIKSSIELFLRSLIAFMFFPMLFNCLYLFLLLIFNCLCLFFKCFFKWINISFQVHQYSLSINLFWRGSNIYLPVGYSYLIILPDGNVNIFAASLLISYCTFLSEILSSIVMWRTRFFSWRYHQSDVFWNLMDDLMGT